MRIAIGRNQIIPAAVGALLALHLVMLGWAAVRHSPVNDEVAHLPAGLSHLLFGRFDLYCVNPPLVRTVAAVPLLFDRPETNWANYSTSPRSEFAVGSDFLEANGEQSHRYFMLSRWACIPFSLLGGYICWRWASELYGSLGGLVSLTLWCFCPNVLAWGQRITPDTGASALGVCATYFFWRWLRLPIWQRSAIAGVVTGLALLTKATWVILFALWPLFWCIVGLFGSIAAVRTRRCAQFGQLSAMLLIALFVLNLGYGFEGFGIPLHGFHFRSRILCGTPLNAAGSTIPVDNRFRDHWLGQVPVPLPVNFVLGIDLQKADFEQNQWAYLAGEWKRGGWWYYYLYALAIKVPLGTWLLILAALFLGKPGKDSWLHELVVLVPGIVILILVSSQTGINRHLRYALPLFPFVYIWCARIGLYVTAAHWSLKVALSLAILWSVCSSLMVYPHSLSYFNELVGGPKGGHAHLLSSNIDWGQDLPYLKAWTDANPTARPFHVALSGIVDPKLYGIDYQEWSYGPKSSADEPLPRSGWYAISVEQLHQPSRKFERFLLLKPVAMAGYSINIYCIGNDTWLTLLPGLGQIGLHEGQP